MTTVSPIASGLDGAVGSDYLRAKNQLVFVEFDGEINVLDLTTRAVHRIGDGFVNLEDVVIAADGLHAYVTERSGNVRIIDLATLNTPANSRVISSGMTAPQQIYLDASRSQLFVVEYAASGRLFRVDVGHLLLPLPGHYARSIAASGLWNAVGVVVTSDLSFAYVSEQRDGIDGHITRIDLQTGRATAVATGLKQPFFLAWADDGESALYFTQRDPALRSLSRLDLTTGALTTLATGLPDKPSSVTRTRPNELVVCSDTVITGVDVDPFVAGPGQYLVGVGKIPHTNLDPTGHANTGPSDPFPGLVAAPFGGEVSAMVDYPNMLAAGAAFYKLVLGAVEITQTFYDYRLDALTGTWVLTPTASSGGFYPVRTSPDQWYDVRLAGVVDTSVAANGTSPVLSLQLFDAAHSPITPGAGSTTSFPLAVDNRLPTAVIETVFHLEGSPLLPVPVNACAVVPPFGTPVAPPLPGTDDQFTFQITAAHPQNLWSWSLRAMWGDNKSASVAGGNTNEVHATVPTPTWKASVAGDPTSRQCAHTFYLGVWDRVIDGESHIHYQDYTKSITLNLSPV